LVASLTALLAVTAQGAPPSAKHLPQNSAPNAKSVKASLEMVRAERDRYWLNARREVYRSVLELIAQQRAETDRGLHFAKIFHGDPTRKELALTFDDGPHPRFTPQILRILKQERVPATFFLVGEMAEKHPDLVRAEAAAGHSVGNHTYDHVSLVKIPPQYVATEIKACGEVIAGVLGRPPHLFRPPGGEYDKDVALTAQTLGYKIVLWTDDPGDYASPGRSAIEKRTLEGVTSGGIILLHDGVQQTINILPDLIRKLKARGYRFVTVDDMLAQPRGAASR
jgi:peptidoglycan/xylan/chitin deacetylase (PgdA/CDA1 family)